MRIITRIIANDVNKTIRRSTVYFCISAICIFLISQVLLRRKQAVKVKVENDEFQAKSSRFIVINFIIENSLSNKISSEYQFVQTYANFTHSKAEIYSCKASFMTSTDKRKVFA